MQQGVLDLAAIRRGAAAAGLENALEAILAELAESEV
jgi:hypothetical protein